MGISQSGSQLLKSASIYRAWWFNEKDGNHVNQIVGSIMGG